MKRCDGVSRREFLRVGGLSALGLTVSDAVRARAASGSRATNCILIWLDGGPSHLDMFDLKPEAPVEVRGPFRPIETSVPGILISEHLPKLARRMHQVCLIRSMTSELGEHNFGRHYLLTGYKPSPVLDYPSFGAVVSENRLGSRTLPSYVAIPDAPPQAGTGYLPASRGPFTVGGDPSRPEFRVRDLDSPAGLTDRRLDRRRAFLSEFDRRSREIEAVAADQPPKDAAFEQAYRLIASPEAKAAFDLSKEDPNLRSLYGHHRLGQSCLLARRLIEGGCPFVTVTDDGWDTHIQIDRSLREGYVGGRAGKLPRLDEALSALLLDLDLRGLLSETLVIVMGEFGRTPKLNTTAGRDHWPRAFSVLLAGSGIAAGRVVGSSDSRGESPADRPTSPSDLARTVYQRLGVDPDREFRTSDGRPVRVNAGGKLVEECLA